MSRFNLAEIINTLKNSYTNANNEYKKTQIDFPLELKKDQMAPLLRTYGYRADMPWLISGHYKENSYEDDPIYGTYCRNFMIQREALIVKRRFAYWLYFIKKVQTMYFDDEISSYNILQYFPPFQEKNAYLQFVDLLKDIYGVDYVLELITEEVQIKNNYFQFIDVLLRRGNNMWEVWGELNNDEEINSYEPL
jgi:hypothetical protein